jgi:hypothetical protein
MAIETVAVGRKRYRGAPDIRCRRESIVEEVLLGALGALGAKYLR